MAQRQSVKARVTGMLQKYERRAERFRKRMILYCPSVGDTTKQAQLEKWMGRYEACSAMASVLRGIELLGPKYGWRAEIVFSRLGMENQLRCPLYTVTKNLLLAIGIVSFCSP